MTYIFILLLGMIAGGIAVFGVLAVKRASVLTQKRQQDAQAKQIQATLQAIDARQKQHDEQAAGLRMERAQLDLEVSRQTADLKAAQAAFEVRIVSYRELQDENGILKHDLQNVGANLRKLELDRELQRQSQETIDQRSKELGSRFLKDNIKWISSSLTPNNYVNCKQRLQSVVGWCREIGFDVSNDEEAILYANLKTEYEKAVRAALEREEQARIKARIREEQALEKEIERELKQLERERTAIKAALEKALAEAKEQRSEEIERLKTRLAEAEEKTQRALSRAQMTRSGNVYVISNIGSFGEGVFKVGMTRRLEPLDRVRELSDASVPFPFDVHMMISSEDAPTLENALHRALHKLRMNKINPRKEFFKTDVEAIRRVVEANHGEVQYVADAEALQYRQSSSMTDEDQEFIEHVYDDLDEDNKTTAVDD